MPDSDFRSSSDTEWNDLLRQLRQPPQAQPRPFFYARVQARLAARQAPVTAWLPSWARRPAYVALLGALVLAMSGDDAALRPAAPASGYGLNPASQLAPP